MDQKEFCVTQDYTIMEVMEVFKRNKERGVVVLGEEGKVCGFLSMGDIIYALVDGKNMYSHIGQIYNHSFIYLREKDFGQALSIFKKRNLSLIPVVNDAMELTDVITARELLNMMEFE